MSRLAIRCLHVLAIAALLTSAAAAQTDPWAPPDPKAESLDWLQLTSGEWLRGEIQGMRSEVLTIDSEELDMLDIDLEDIAAIRSPRTLTYTFTDERYATGTASLKDGAIKVRVGEEVQEFAWADILSVIEGPPRERNYWSLNASVGLVGRSGNTNQSDMNTIALLRREALRTRFDVNYTGNFSELEGEIVTNNHRGDAKIDLFVSRKFYVTPGFVELFSDDFQNIDLRVLAGLSLGWHVHRSTKLEWDLDFGGGYTKTQFVSVEEGTDSSEENGSITPATSLEWDPTGDLDINFSANVQVGVPDTKTTIYHVLGLLEYELTDILDFTISITWDRVENPRTNADGITPEQDDFRTAIGLGVSL